MRRGVAGFLVLVGLLFIPTAMEAQPLTCPAEPPEEFGVKPPKKDKDEVPLLAAHLDSETHELHKKHNEPKATQNSAKRHELHELLKARKQHLVEAMRHQPEAAFAAVLAEPERQELATLTQGCVETIETLEGKLEVTVVDFFQEGLSQERYILITPDQQRIVLHLVGNPKDFLESRTTVRVKGVRIDDELVVDATRSVEAVQDLRGGIEVLSQPGNPPVIGEQRTVIILANFNNTTQPSLTATDMRNFLTTSLAPYYAENSYNTISVTGDVVGWYTLPISQSCSQDPGINEAIKAADNGVFFPNYGRLIVVAPFGPSCAWAGRATIGKTTLTTADGLVTMSWAAIGASYGANLLVVGHEMGHNFGNHHAAFLDCGDVTIADSGCTVSEYGDPYDILGNTRAFHFNAPHKENVGWLQASNIQTPTANGSYVLEPIEIASSGLQTLKLQRSATDYLYLEYRQPIGFDTITSPTTNLYSGALLHSLLSPGKTALLDPTPLDSMSTIALTAGSSFTDPATAAKVITVSTASTGLTVDVVLGKTDFTPPTVSMTSPTGGTTVSGSVPVEATASDASGIQKVEFYRSSLSSPPFATDLDAPYSVLWDTTHVPNGSTVIYAKAYDRSGELFGVPGNTAIAGAPVTVNNTDPTPPSVTVTAPLNGATVANPVTVTADATDNVGVYSVAFWKDADTTAFAVDYDAPYTTSVTLSDGQHTHYAKASDFVGNITTSSVISITVGDTVPPTVSLSAPADGATVSGTSVTISATASDNIGVTKVEFYRDGSVLLGTDTAAPYSITWNSTTVANGSHTLFAKAYDAPGNVATSASRTVTVSNSAVDTTPPTVTITNPLNGTTVPRKSTVTITATASDNVGVTKVEFYVAGALKCTDTSAPYTCAWTTGASPGRTYQLQAQATDAAGNVGKSAVVTVTSQ